MRSPWLFVALLFTGCAAESGDTVDRGRDESPAEPAAGSTPPPTTNNNTNPPSEPSASPPGEPPPPPPSEPLTTLKILTYNVAGLPQGISGSSPAQNTALISPKLNPFDLVAVQEDFSYHPQLISAATHPHKTPPMAAASPTDLGDGLNALSRLPLSGLTRTKWSQCNGLFDQKNDCLTSKGFAMFVLDLGQGVSVDVYDAHFDAGRSDGDVKARNAQVTQLTQTIATKSAGHAVIVIGDTNMKDSDEPTFQQLLTGANLTCACRSLKCAEPERIDRVMFRASSSVKLSATQWLIDSSFVDAAGKPLSDHEPVRVDLAVSK